MPAISKKNRQEPEDLEGVTFESSSGNIFADLGLPNPELRLLKAKLTMKLQATITQQKLSMPKAAKKLGVPTEALKILLRGSTSGFSIDHLLQLLATLGHTFEITLRPMSNKPLTTARSGTNTPSPAAGA